MRRILVRGMGSVPRTRGDGPLSAPTEPTMTGGVPRTRGDGPSIAEPILPSWTCSPHTRGWTARSNGAHPDHIGVPRTRGDGPIAHRSDVVNSGVFPAHAGMDRGVRSSAAGVSPCSPHTRGWTAIRAATVGARLGVPRTRGDGPERWPSGCWSYTVFPAHAGMDRPGQCPCRSHGRVPRTRGDGPLFRKAPCLAQHVFPAHAGMDRGWGRAENDHWAVFPAHAGMDRCRCGS